MFIKGWQDLLTVVQPVVDAIKTVASLNPFGAGTSIPLPGAFRVREASRRVPGSVVFKTPSAAAPKAGAGAPGLPPTITGHAVCNGGDIHIHIAGHHFAKVTRREIQKAMMAGA